MLLAPYILLFLPFAVVFANPDITFILRTMGIATLTVLVIEFMTRKRAYISQPFSAKHQYSSLLPLVAQSFTALGAGADLGAAMLGVGSISAQVSGRGPGALGTALTAVGDWDVIGLALILASYAMGLMTRPRMTGWVVVLLLVQATVAAQTAILAPFASFLIFVTAFFLYFGQIGPKRCLALCIAVLVAWPTAYALRNELRVDNNVRVDASVTALERLRYDKQITAAAPYPPGVDVGQPEPTALLRYALLPRFLDSDRPALDVSARINVFLGGSPTSSFNFLPVATLYFLEGPLMVIAVYAALAILVRIVAANGFSFSPGRAVLLALIFYGPLGWFSSYPASLVGFVQGLVAALPIALAVHLSRTDTRWALRSKTHQVRLRGA